MFDPQIRYTRQSQFNLPRSSFTEIEIASKKWQLYNNCNFSVHITDKCNADCAFCIAHLRYLNDSNVYIKPELDSFDRYLEGLSSAIGSIAPVLPSVSITGGEPTVSNKLGPILDVLIASNIRKKTITTNGSGLYYKIPGGVTSKTVLEKLAEYKLDYLNISRAHWDEDINAKLMTMNKNLVSNSFLKEAIQQAKKSSMGVRLSCALLKDGVNDLNSILTYLDWARSIGVDSVIFRQLMKFNEVKATPGRIPLFCKSQEIDLMPVWESMDSSNLFTLEHQVLGYYYYVEVRHIQEMTVVTESADLNLIPVQLAKFSDQLGAPTAFELVYHPNGNLCAGWNENELIMKSF